MITEEMREAMRENQNRDLEETQPPETAPRRRFEIRQPTEAECAAEDEFGIGCGGLLVKMGIDVRTGKPLKPGATMALPDGHKVEPIRQTRITTYSGRSVDPFDLKPDDITLDDAIHQLPNLCRFGGAVDTFYSVAQHSVLVASLLLLEHSKTDSTFLSHDELMLEIETAGNIARWGLVHDVHEIVFGDIVAPIRDRVGLDAFELAAQKAVAAHFGITWPPPFIDRADMHARAIEWRVLRSHIPRPPELDAFDAYEPVELLNALNKKTPWYMPHNFFEMDRREARGLYAVAANELGLHDDSRHTSRRPC